MDILSDNMVKIQFALENGGVVRNYLGEVIKLPDCTGRTNDCIKCFITDRHYYWSTAAHQQGLTVNGEIFDHWFEDVPFTVVFK